MALLRFVGWASTLVLAALLVRGAYAAEEVAERIVDVYTHDDRENFGGVPQDMISGSGMNGIGCNGLDGWPQTDCALNASAWVATSNDYACEWQSQSLLQGISPQKAWVILDLGTAKQVARLHLWNMREPTALTRRVVDFHVHVGSASITPPSHTLQYGAYNFVTIGWTYHNYYRPFNGDSWPYFALDVNKNGRFIGIEILSNGGDANRVGLAEVAVTTIMSPGTILCGSQTTGTTGSSASTTTTTTTTAKATTATTTATATSSSTMSSSSSNSASVASSTTISSSSSAQSSTSASAQLSTTSSTGNSVAVDTTDSSSSSDDTTLIIIIACAVGGCLLLSLCVVCFVRSRQQSDKGNQDQAPAHSDDSDEVVVYGKLDALKESGSASSSVEEVVYGDLNQFQEH